MRRPILITTLSGAALLLAACGSNATTAGGGQQGGTTNAAAGGGSGIHVAKTSLGKVLVDSNGFTVYMFTADKMHKSNCNAACLHFWPAVSPSSKGSSVMAKLGSTKDMTGSPIATVNGMPVYTYSGDHAPGDVAGQNSNKFGGRWYVMSPSGQPIKAGGSSGSGGGGNSGGGGGGGGYSY